MRKNKDTQKNKKGSREIIIVTTSIMIILCYILYSLVARKLEVSQVISELLVVALPGLLVTMIVIFIYWVGISRNQ